MKKISPVKLIFGLMGGIFFCLGAILLIIGVAFHRAEEPEFLLVFGIVGGIFTVLGCCFLPVVFLAGKKKRELLTKGQKIYAEVTNGQICYNYTVNGRHPFKLECKYEDPYTGATYLFSSECVWEDPLVYVGHSVPVYVDPNKMSRYYVDIESLKESVQVFDYR